jgi:hypothetical protein
MAFLIAFSGPNWTRIPAIFPKSPTAGESVARRLPARRAPRRGWPVEVIGLMTSAVMVLRGGVETSWFSRFSAGIPLMPGGPLIP